MYIITYHLYTKFGKKEYLSNLSLIQIGFWFPYQKFPNFYVLLETLLMDSYLN